MSYTVECAEVPHISMTFYTFPTGCRVGGGSLTRRSKLVTVPYAHGQKETADGKLGGGDVHVTGRIWASSGSAAITLVATMEDALLEHAAAFYVWEHWIGETPCCYPVHCCKSVAHNIPDGPGGLWIDIDCTFPRGPNPAMQLGA
ncbi:hypothetical protein KAT82_07770 [bacterium]|nr:hypothetical protein [bacterium]